MADLGGAPALPQPSDALVRDGCAPLAQAGYACDSRRTVVGSAQHDAGAGERPKRRSRLSVKDVGWAAGRLGAIAWLQYDASSRRPAGASLGASASLLLPFCVSSSFVPSASCQPTARRRS